MVSSSVGSSVGIGYGKLEGYSLVYKSPGSESRTGLGSSVGISDGKFGYYVGIPARNLDGKMEGSVLGEKLFGS